MRRGAGRRKNRNESGLAAWMRVKEPFLKLFTTQEGIGALGVLVVKFLFLFQRLDEGDDVFDVLGGHGELGDGGR